MPLTPVFGVSASATFLAAPPPFILPFPGVPMLTGTLGASVGIPGLGGVAGGLTVGPGGITGGLSGGIGPVSGNIAVGPGGISGGLSGAFGPFSGGINVGPGGEISGGIGGGIGIPGVGGISGGIGFGPEGITADLSANAQLGPFALSLNASLPPLMTADKPGGLFRGPVWGIFDMNSRAIAPWETVTKVSYRHEMTIADFPIEDGSFASYNKVQVPYDARVTFVVGGGHGAARRTELLAALERAVLSLEYFTVVTPEATYYRANLTHLEYTRESNHGVNLLVVEVWVQEVRRAETALTAEKKEAGDENPKSPTAQAEGNNGQVQAEPLPPPTDKQAKQISQTIGEPQAPPPVGTQDLIPVTGTPHDTEHGGSPPPPQMPVGNAVTEPRSGQQFPRPDEVPPPLSPLEVFSRPGGVGADPRYTTPDPLGVY